MGKVCGASEAVARVAGWRGCGRSWSSVAWSRS